MREDSQEAEMNDNRFGVRASLLSLFTILTILKATGHLPWDWLTVSIPLVVLVVVETRRRVGR